MAQTPLSLKNNEKLQNLVKASFDLLWTGYHRESEFHQKFALNAIRDGIYQFAPRLYSGKISKRAVDALQDGRLIRAQLCKEHPNPRVDTALDVINTFEYSHNKGLSNTVIQAQISEILYEGSEVNLVLSEENTRLMPYQKQGLSADMCYKLANVELVPDIKEPERLYHYQGRTWTTQPEIVRDLKISITTVRRRIKQGLITVERKAA